MYDGIKQSQYRGSPWWGYWTHDKTTNGVAAGCVNSLIIRQMPRRYACTIRDIVRGLRYRHIRWCGTNDMELSGRSRITEPRDCGQGQSAYCRVLGMRLVPREPEFSPWILPRLPCRLSERHVVSRGPEAEKSCKGSEPMGPPQRFQTHGRFEALPSTISRRPP